MSEAGSWLWVRAAGRDLLLSTRDLREVVAPSPPTPLPGGLTGIQGVVIHQGEFLPVLAWEDLPGGRRLEGPPEALAVLRTRLALPLERLVRTLEELPGPGEEPEDTDPTRGWLGASVQLNGVAVRQLDVEGMLDLLRRFRSER